MTPAVIEDAMAQWEGARGLPSWSLSNHDVIRFPTRLADDNLQRTKLMMALLLSLRGAAFIYQGDELGLPHAEVPFDRLRDPEAIAFWPSGIGRDGARTPMPWTRDAEMAGFTEAHDAWLPLDPVTPRLAVDAQAADPGSMLHFTRAMIALRREHARAARRRIRRARRARSGARSSGAPKVSGCSACLTLDRSRCGLAPAGGCAFGRRRRSAPDRHGVARRLFCAFHRNLSRSPGQRRAVQYNIHWR